MIPLAGAVRRTGWSDNGAPQGVPLSFSAVPTKASISLRVDREVLDGYKSQGRGYQTRMNAVLRAFRDASLLVPGHGE